MKKLLLIPIIAALVISIGGCSNSGNTPSKSEPSSSSSSQPNAPSDIQNTPINNSSKNQELNITLTYGQIVSIDSNKIKVNIAIGSNFVDDNPKKNDTNATLPKGQGLPQSGFPTKFESTGKENEYKISSTKIVADKLGKNLNFDTLKKGNVIQFVVDNGTGMITEITLLKK